MIAGEVCAITNSSLLQCLHTGIGMITCSLNRDMLQAVSVCHRTSGHQYQVPDIHSVKAVPPLKAHR